MPVYIIRWPNGDIAFTEARDPDDARLSFDQFAEPMNLPMLRVPRRAFSLSLKLTDDGRLEVDEWGETLEEVIAWGYPVLSEAFLTENPKAIHAAVKKERARVKQTRKPGQLPTIHAHNAKKVGRIDPEAIAEHAKSMGMTPTQFRMWMRRIVADEMNAIPVKGKGGGNVIKHKPKK